MCILLILSGLRLSPKWLLGAGFRPIIEQATATRTHQGRVDERFFVSWGKYFPKGSLVALDGNNSIENSNSMYVVAVVPISSSSRVLELMHQVLVESEQKIIENSASWASGGKGVALFNCDNSSISIGVKRGASWSAQLSTEVLGSSASCFPFEIKDKQQHVNYQLAYRVGPMPGVFKLTQVVTVLPQYCIVNCMNEIVELKQMGDESPSFLVEPYRTRPWHMFTFNPKADTNVRLKCSSSGRAVMSSN